jgi:hypothetical protein
MGIDKQQKGTWDMRKYSKDTKETVFIIIVGIGTLAGVYMVDMILTYLLLK